MDGNAAGRRAVRHFASGVAVLTVTTGARTPHGTTVSAVTAISREPLLVGVCLHRRSSFVRHLGAAGRFSVSVLRAEQQGVAQWFADPGRPAGTAQFDPVPWQPDPRTGAPLLTGALAHFSCRLRDRLTLGDHDLLVAEVETGAAGTGTPLLSFAGRLMSPEPEPIPRGA
ncbi:flavin reductase family protein [Actinoplanes sp. N902-109]|uniref:flavin reductase family protein n=1 Tax=Actinoplanes sp. (strain N902-109) TaxID=649831 RepID=UPI0003293B24|nr:flavin reductase family protein [Actinoplanes sp. N902-109]AGL15831.1 flavin reductase domain-containing protein FMN-binding [Actinoplanes sp. N902-109]